MPTQLLADYPAATDRFDELLETAGRPRPHWSGLFAELVTTSAAEIQERLTAAGRQLRESGVTYNVYADPQGQDRPWELDVLPLILGPAEWAEIEAGVAQRADLLNRVLADLYGPQRLLAQGLIPPALVFGHSGFLRAAHGMRVPGDVYLQVYAADLARSPDGRWWVLADRTQAPSGAGYALENRLVVQRIFPTLFRDLRVQHLARFFAALRESLALAAPRGDGPTLTVLLTPGPYNETYFEHTLLARYLGFPLVEGSDLTVRDGRVWLKTIDGLRRVHAILRRQDDDYCDPLELRADSALGVAGLLDCARRGTVLIGNALGSGLLEGGALLGFLPQLAQALIGEPLRLPSIATWWCGEPAAFEDAMNRIDGLVFKPADPADRFDPLFGTDLDPKERRALRERIAARPGRFVAQELVLPSQAPVLDRRAANALGARGIGLRVYATATPSGYRVMPGGLTRVAASRSARVVSMQRGGGSKDTWVQSAGAVDTSFTLLRQTVDAASVVRSGTGVSSRIAENLFWLGRYAERCEDTARLLRVALGAMLEDPEHDDNARTPAIALARRFGTIEAAADPERALLAAVASEEVPFGLPANLRRLERVAFNLRDRMSADNWRSINALLLHPGFGRKASLAEALDLLDRTLTGLTTLSGFALDGMTRDNGWRFLSLGRRLERLGFQCLAIQVAASDGLSSGLTWLLELADSIVTYRSRYASRPEWLPVLDLLILDEANPRAPMFLAQGIEGYLARLEQEYGACGRVVMSPGLDALRRIDPARDLQPESPALAELLELLRGAAFGVAERLAERFFSHASHVRWAPLASTPA